MTEYATGENLYAAYLRHPNIRIDSRKVSSGDLFVGLAGTQVQGNKYAAAALAAGAAFAVVDDPEVVVEGDDRYLLVPDSLKALQEMAMEHRRRHRMPVLAITGSNGKTTTKELVNAVMSRQYRVHCTPGNYNNHLGLPLTILMTPPDTEMTILEMGANHVGEIAELCRLGRPTHGLVTNVGEAHLEGFGGIEGVIKGKGELYDYLATNRGVAFINADEDHLTEMAAANNRLIFYKVSEQLTSEEPALEIGVHSLHPFIDVSFLNENGELMRTEVQLSGKHNLQNVKTAIAVGKYFKVGGAKIAEALSSYRSDNHRSQLLEHRGVSFYWDAYNANPSSVVASLSGFGTDHPAGDAVIILGEMLELGEAEAAAHRKVALRAGQTARTVILVGAAMKDVAREFDRPWFSDSTALAAWFWEQSWDGKTVFVKGSRGNRLERLLAD
ncbi:UDP-N-acetylmuramoyl-tripeptide--D-alanyl-D-alanine ligase [Neolewinella agarilytica]|uniref:UDP-N-acetylmuramoyl-tripeptide--D-alanyl-D- alanine ligase n=1 Tax=Neolewinella agarilytica TaxID=478744 RepID=UPI002354BA52|nr:UDP-N-acetylmuramoyl-tripeptide--D-alanyl-D-alanine ligase [Neolewinella agarilytica]